MEPREVLIEEVTFTYKDFEKPAIRDINLAVDRGEMLVITGPTGAGKSTLSLLLNGVVPKFLPGILEGKVLVKNADVAQKSVVEMAQQVGFVFQDPETQLFGMTVEEDVAFGPANLGLPYDEIMQRIQKSINELRLKGMEERKPFQLSGGEKQSVAIAGAYAMLPDIIVFDEPTSMLDPAGKKLVFEMITEIKEKHGITAIVVEHEMDYIAQYADKLAIMDKGQLALIGKPSEVFKEYKKLTEQGVRLPQAVELGAMLQEAGLIDNVPLTTREIIDKLQSLLGGKTVKIPEGLKQSTNPGCSEGNSVIEINNLSHTYRGDVKALKGIDLQIKEGEFIGIIGQNGAGKTTLARHINGLLRPTDGKVIVLGEDTKEKSVAQLAEKVGFVFQNPDEQLFKEAVKDELSFGPQNLKMKPEKIEKRVLETMEQIGLKEYAEVWPKYLTKGERQRLALGTVITMDPDILIVDEPTTGQDWRESLWVMDILAGLNEQGKTVIVISHSMDIVARYCHRIVVMAQGRIIADDKPEEVFSNEENMEYAHIEPPAIFEICREIFGPEAKILHVKQAFAMLKAVLPGGVTDAS